MPTARLAAVQGLYAITDPRLIPAERLLPVSEAALQGGARLLQYRDKDADAFTRRQRAAGLVRLCRQYDALFLVNDDPALAAEVDADGVHLGQSDGSVARARAIIGEDRLIGVSCHGSLELAAQAAAEGADYLALGRFYTSHTKPQAPPAAIPVLAEARRRFPHQRLVAIGGITPANAEPLITAGADAVAVIHALFAADDVAATARRFSTLFTNKP